MRGTSSRAGSGSVDDESAGDEGSGVGRTGDGLGRGRGIWAKGAEPTLEVIEVGDGAEEPAIGVVDGVHRGDLKDDGVGGAVEEDATALKPPSWDRVSGLEGGCEGVDGPMAVIYSTRCARTCRLNFAGSWLLQVLTFTVGWVDCKLGKKEKLIR